MIDYSLPNYALSTFIETHELVIQRDTATKDAFGAEAKTGLVPLGTFVGRFWWWSVHGEGGFDLTSDPGRTVAMSGGGALLKPGQDIRESDIVTEVRQRGSLIVSGPFRVTSVRNHADHMELSLESP